MRKIFAIGLVVVLALGVCALPVDAGAPRHGGFQRGGSWHGGHGHFHGGHGHVVVGFGFYGGWPYYGYGYGYPYPYYPYYGYGYPYSPPVVYTAPPASYPAPAAAEPPAVQREVVYPHGKYVLEGDGVNTPYRWIWIGNTQTPDQQPPPR